MTRRAGLPWVATAECGGCGLQTRSPLSSPNLCLFRRLVFWTCGQQEPAVGRVPAYSHLGHELYGFDRNVEHEAFLSWLYSQIVELRADALIVTGDVYD